MKKSKILVSVLLCLVLALTGCGGSKVGKEAVTQGKLAMAQKEYDKALGSFKLAKDEGVKDKEVESMVKILNSYLDGKKLLSEGKLEEARENIEFIDKEYEKYEIKEDVDSLKLEFDTIDETLEKEDTVIKLLNEKNNTEAMEVLGTISSNIEKYFSIEEIKDKKGEIDSKLSEIKQVEAEKEAAAEKAKKEKAAKAAQAGKKDYYLRRLANLEASMGDAEALMSDGVTSNLVEGTGIVYSRWDDMLNEIYRYLKTQLPEGQMHDLKMYQRTWVKNRNSEAEAAARESGGSFASVAYNSVSGELTKARCYEMVNTYLK